MWVWYRTSFPTVRTSSRSPFQHGIFELGALNLDRVEMFEDQITYLDPDPLSVPASLAVTAPASLFCGNVSQEITLNFLLFHLFSPLRRELISILETHRSSVWRHACFPVSNRSPLWWCNVIICSPELMICWIFVLQICWQLW